MPKTTPRASLRIDLLAPSLPRSVGFGPVFFPSERRLVHGGVERLPAPSDSATLVVLDQALLPEPPKDASPAPFLEVPMKAAPRDELGRNSLPRAAGSHHEVEPVGHSPRVEPRTPSLGAATMLGNQLLHSSPQRIWHACVRKGSDFHGYVLHVREPWPLTTYATFQTVLAGQLASAVFLAVLG